LKERINPMFKKFVKEENFSGTNQVKSSIGRKIRAAILTQYPALQDKIDEIIPKNQPLIVAKCSNHINLIVVNNQILFFNEREGPYYPTLRLLHRYPHILPHIQVDRGAIKFVMQGANIMCPGMTSPGGRLPEDLQTNSIVAVMAEGKQHPLALGLTKLSAKEIREQNKGIGVDNIHYLNDGLWKLVLD